MNLKQIKEEMLNYSSKEKKFTIISIFVYAILTTAIFGLLFFTNAGAKTMNKFFPSLDKLPAFFSYLPFISVAAFILMGIYKIFEINKRATTINSFLDEVINQKIVVFNPSVSYKMYIPLGKLKLNFLPINYAMIQFRNKKSFYIPMPSQCIQPLKSINNGSENSSVESTWDNL